MESNGAGQPEGVADASLCGREAAMPNMLRDHRFSADADDLRGTTLYDPEGEKLGKIDDVVFDPETGQIRYVVVDAGGWLKSRRFLLHPDDLRPIAEQGDKLAIRLTKAEVGQFPVLEDDVLESEDRFREYQKAYRAARPGFGEVGETFDSSTEDKLPTQSPFTPRFLRFQEQVTNYHAGTREKRKAS
jgi:sporulation protein YlmC with PRC-barrel domain